MFSSLQEFVHGAAQKLAAGWLIKGLAVFICLVNMATLMTVLQQHWGRLPEGQQIAAVSLLIMYPVPCLHFFRKFQDPNLSVIVVLSTFCLLSLTTSLMFQ